MSLIEDERNRRIKKYLNTNPQKGQELGQVMQGQNEIYGINSALQDNLAMEQAQAQAQQQTIGSLQQASELVAQMGQQAQAQVAPIQNKAARLNEAIKSILPQDGIKKHGKQS